MFSLRNKEKRLIYSDENKHLIKSFAIVPCIEGNQEEQTIVELNIPMTLRGLSLPRKKCG